MWHDGMTVLHTTKAVRRSSSRRLARLRTVRGELAVAAILLSTLALHVEWLVRFRRGYLTEWDESGYMQYALNNFDALHDHGVVAFLRAVGNRGTFGPLLPLVTALSYPIVTRGIIGSLLVVVAFFALLVLATYGLARRLGSERWALVAALAVAAVPGVTDYSRLFHFAVPATACMTAALWTLVASDGFARRGWSVAFGLLVAMTLLSRTMTVAYLPGLALAALVAVPPGLWRSRVRNLVLALLALFVVAGPWYGRHAHDVYHYLFGTGYGAEAAAYGPRYAFLSWAYWSRELRADLYYLWLPLSVVVALSLLAAGGQALLYRRGFRIGCVVATPFARAVTGLVLVVVEGYVALTSSRNVGSAFPLPWLPALVVLGVLAAASLRSEHLRAVLATAFVAVSFAALLAKSGSVAIAARERSVHLPGLGSVVVSDGRGVIQQIVEGAGYDIGSPARPLPSEHRRWLPLERRITGWAISNARVAAEPVHLTLGLDDPLLGNTRLHLAGQLWYHQDLAVDYLRSAVGGDTVAAYRRQLEVPRPENELVTEQARPGSTISRSKVEAAARSLGFMRVRSLRLPDGRPIWLWWRKLPAS